MKPGVTTRELDKVAEEFIRDHGATPTFKGFPNQYGEPFPASLCTSVNEQVVHGIPGDIVLKDGDIVSVDCGTYMNGFCGDSAYTFCVGEVDEEVRNLLTGIENAVHGKRLGDIGYAIQQHCEAQSYEVVNFINLLFVKMDQVLIKPLIFLVQKSCIFKIKSYLCNAFNKKHF